MPDGRADIAAKELLRLRQSPACRGCTCKQTAEFAGVYRESL